jgi:iron complex transport system ATP-binding protein
MSVETANLSFAYGRIPALRDVSLRAEAERITAVLGPNAAGKSTLLRCLIGALKPQQGSASIDGIESRRMSPRSLAQRVAYVPQRSVVSAAFTVRQVIELGRYALAPQPGKIDHAIERLDLEDVADRPYPHLSAGQQQRVTMARALAQLAPDGHLILDEPVSAMDLRHVHDVMALLRAVARGGATVIMAIHDLALAAIVSDAVWLLDGGKVVASGPVGDVLTVERLQQVFGVSFQWLDGPWGSPILTSQPAG